MTTRYTVAVATAPNRPLEAYGPARARLESLRPVVVRARAERAHVYILPVDDVGLLARTAAYRVREHPPADPSLPLAEVPPKRGVRVDVTLSREAMAHARKRAGKGPVSTWIAGLVEADRTRDEKK